MRIKPLSSFSISEIETEINLIDEEIRDVMHPISYDRYKKLSEYKQLLNNELKIKQKGMVT